MGYLFKFGEEGNRAGEGAALVLLCIQCVQGQEVVIVQSSGPRSPLLPLRGDSIRDPVSGGAPWAWAICGWEGAKPRYQEMQGDERPELGTQELVSELGVEV